MNIQDKNRLYEEIHRVLKPYGLLAFQEPMAGEQPLLFPVMWARDSSRSFLLRPNDLKALIQSLGFGLREWQDGTLNVPPRAGTIPRQSIQYLVMGEDAELINATGRRNEAEGRLTHARAVFEKRENRSSNLAHSL
jgi:hypothetical protein